jgi:hypothetical protein
MKEAVLILSACLAACGEEPRGDTPYLPDGSVTGLYPVDRERAIVVVDHRHVFAIDAGGAVRWWRTLPVEIPLQDGVQIAEGVVTVRGVGGGEASIAGIALDGGRPLWTTSLGAFDEVHVPVDAALMSAIVPGRVIEARDDGTLIVLDRRDGEVIARWQATYGTTNRKPVAIGPETLLHVSAGDLVVHRLGAGASARVGEVGIGAGCLRDGHYLALESTDTRVDLVSVEVATLRRTAWTQIPMPDEGEYRWFQAHGCGTRRDRLVYIGERPGGVAIQALDSSTGAALARHDLPHDHLKSIGTAEWGAGRGLFDGPLPRHVAFPNEHYRTMGEMEDPRSEIVVVEVDTGAVTQRIPVADWIELREVFRDGPRLVLLGWHGELRAIDLETGALTEHRAPEGNIELKAEHVVDGHYWTSSGRWPASWSASPL